MFYPTYGSISVPIYTEYSKPLLKSAQGKVPPYAVDAAYRYQGMHDVSTDAVCQHASVHMMLTTWPWGTIRNSHQLKSFPLLYTALFIQKALSYG